MTGKLLITYTGSILCLIFLSLPGRSAAVEPLRFGVPLFTGDEPVPESFVDRVNVFLRPDDIIFVKGIPQTAARLKKVRHGKVAVIRQSLGDLKKDLQFLLSQKVKLDYLCYNLEAWMSSQTPQEEKDDPVRAVINARRLADEHNLGLIVAPDTSITLLAHGAEMASHADIFVIQFQRWQDFEADNFQKLVARNIWWVNKGNPDIPVFAQLSTNPPLTGEKPGGAYAAESPYEIMAKVQSIKREVKGVVFQLWTEENGIGRFFKFLELYRPPE